MALDNERLYETIKDVLQDRYFQQPSTTSHGPNQTQQLVYHATKSLHALARHAKPENPKELPKAYLDVMGLTWRLAEAVYLYLRTTEGTEGNNPPDLEEFIRIAKDIREFMEGLESSDLSSAAYQHAEAQLIDRLRLVTDVIFSMNVHDAVVQLVNSEL